MFSPLFSPLSRRLQKFDDPLDKDIHTDSEDSDDEGEWVAFAEGGATPPARARIRELTSSPRPPSPSLIVGLFRPTGFSQLSCLRAEEAFTVVGSVVRVRSCFVESGDG